MQPLAPKRLGVIANSVLLAASLSLSFFPATAQAELAISANDGKQLQNGDPVPVTPDSVSVIDLGHYPPRVIGSVQVPASMIGPPDAVAVGPGEKFAIVTAAQKFDPADPMHPAADDKVSVIDLSHPAHPRVLQTLPSGAGASGVSINPAGTLVLVAAKGGDAIFVFRLAGNRLSPAGRVDLGKGAAPTDVIFAPDGRKAYAVAWGVTKIMELAVDGSRVTPTGNDVVTGRNPYGAVVTPDGAWLINTNVGGALEGGNRSGTITMVDLKAHKLAVSLATGPVPEHVALSPDGKNALVVVANGAATVKSNPRYDSVVGILKIYAVGPGTLTEVAHADTGHWCQGATWSDDGRLILQQCATEREIEVFRFDGHALARDKDATMVFQSRPGAIATQHSR
jgi:DNA-binding beta-propeller fold protein YncE